MDETINLHLMFCPICKGEMRVKKVSVKRYDEEDIEDTKIIDLECVDCADLIDCKIEVPNDFAHVGEHVDYGKLGEYLKKE